MSVGHLAFNVIDRVFIILQIDIEPYVLRIL